MYKKDRGDAVLITFILSMMFIVAVAAFAVDISKNILIKNQMNSAIQQSAQIAVKEINARGSLNQESYKAFVKTLNQELGNQLAAPNNSVSSCPISVDGVDMSGDKGPYFKLALSPRRGADLGDSAFSINNPTYITGTLPEIATIYNSESFKEKIRQSGTVYRVLDVKMYASYPNIMLGMVGIPCQEFEIRASAVAFGSQEDL